MSNADLLNPIKNLVTNKTFAIYDYAFIKALRELPWRDWFEQEKTFRIRQDYLLKFHDWIMSSRLNTVKGLERFTATDLINGTTQTFDEAYYRHADRRLRFFRGEYAYHRRCFNNWKFIEDEPLHKNDFLIISNPFCSTGDKHEKYDEILKICTELKIPVIIDCAYFGTCLDLNIDVTSTCIESVSFSLSKGIGLGDIRSGIRYSFFDDSFPISQQNKYEHTVLAAAKIGLYMMSNFSPDFIPSKYRFAQLSVCNELNIRATKCMHLALSERQENLESFLVDDKYYRIGIRDAVKYKLKSI